MKKANSTNQPVFLVPQVPSIHSQIDDQRQQVVSSTPAPPEQQKKTSLLNGVNVYKTSTLKSNSNLIVNNEISKKKLGSQLLISDTLDVSKISALENAISTNGCVVVTKTDMPKDLKKCLKDEFKKDKKQCIIS